MKQQALIQLCAFFQEWNSSQLLYLRQEEYLFGNNGEASLIKNKILN